MSTRIKTAFVLRAAARPLRNRSGGYTVEAAIVLPLFILAVMTIAFLIRIAGIEGTVMQITADEAGRLALDSYAVRSGVLFPPVLEHRILDTCEDVGSAEVRNFRYLTEKGGKGGIISCRVRTRVVLPLPFPLLRGTEITTGVMARAWIGKDSIADPMPFSEMETDGSSVTVWVFPQRGERYHKESCLFVSNEPRQTILSKDVRHHYTPCSICDPGGLPDGALVYCFPAYGEVYHRGGCSQVDKYVIPMDLAAAESRGYTPCSKCGGF